MTLNSVFQKNFVARIILAMFLMTMLFAVAPVSASADTAQITEIMDQQLEKQEEYRFWEIRTELHRIHHHLEFMPYMVFAVIGIFLVQAISLGIKIKEMYSKKN